MAPDSGGGPVAGVAGGVHVEGFATARRLGLRTSPRNERAARHPSGSSSCSSGKNAHPCPPDA